MEKIAQMYDSIGKYCIFAAVLTGLMAILGCVMAFLNFTPGWVALAGFSAVASIGSAICKKAIKDVLLLIEEDE